MGNSCTGAALPEEEVNRNKAINKQLLLSEGNKEVKLLLLGPGESGKSTILKQFRIIYGKGFPNEEKNSYKPIIYSNIITSMSALMRAVNKSGDFERLSDANQQYSELITSPEITALTELNPEVTQAIFNLWKDPVVKERFQNKSDVQIIDSAEYFFERLPDITKPDWIPTDDDILHSRARTTGINELCFAIANNSFRVVDVGGQRAERRKWIHCFDSVNAIFFIVAISEYDQTLREDEATNRMHESLKLLEEICVYNGFQSAKFILFMNKRDLFETKLKKVPLKTCFPEYEGDGKPDEKEKIEHATTFLREKFLSKKRKDAQSMYPHVTCATNTDNIKFVFLAIQDIVLNETLQTLGF